jgi:hypothetical protein
MYRKLSLTKGTWQEHEVIFFFYGKGDENHQFGTGYFIYHRMVSAVMRVEFVSDRMSHTVLRGCWYHVVKEHAPSEEKSYDSKDSFYEELEQVFDHFPKCHMKILLGDFNAKVERERIFSNRQLRMQYYIRMIIVLE